MPSAEQIVNDVKAILNQIAADTSATAQQAGDIRDDTKAIRKDLASLGVVTQAGFANVSQGIATLVDRENETIRLIEVNDEHNRVALCWLETLANLACEQLRRLETQVELQASIDRSTANMRDVLQLVHAREALEVQRERELSERIEECCAEPPPEPKPCFTPCTGEDIKPYKRKIANFKPLPPPKPQVPPR